MDVEKDEKWRSEFDSKARLEVQSRAEYFDDTVENRVRLLTIKYT
jgi:hypothetical protein